MPPFPGRHRDPVELSLKFKMLREQASSLPPASVRNGQGIRQTEQLLLLFC
eukprot:CAMPEP_0176138056 /NCGR_PEP_ID=MMETSP0120_2-20121206/70118_1 /TAXON_ID=160619 /ORGANISM="Kryptoperidinium foliaceum, Strain CCMP 1326" /LENGTH=50 /DNA_ID=CAMNT_0017473969 /DNA_START=18 /DNA_END=167 /DNA_ORIENTATION=+